MMCHNSFSKAIGLLAVALSIDAAAQLPYTSSNSVPSHSSREYRVWENLALNGDTVHIVTSGTEVVWDFSSLQLNEPFIHTVYFEPASATPYHNYYPQANVVQWETNASGNSDYNYFNNSPFELRLLGGIHVSDGEAEVIEFCPDPFLILDYPMTIGSGVQHTYDCEASNNEIDNWVIMATGRVIFNGGSIDDLVLWRSIFTGPGYSQTAYFWTQMDNMLYPVVRYLPGDHLKIREPISQTAIGIEGSEEVASLLSIYPNPATQVLTIQASMAGGKTQVIVRDAMGRVVKEAGFAVGPINLNIGELIPGLYTVEAVSDTDRARASFLKQ